MNIVSRRRFLQGTLALASLGLVVGCGVLPSPVRAPVGPRRVGYLASGVDPQGFEVFREGLRELGYVEGRDVAIERRDSERDFERLPALAAELVNWPAEVIVVAGGPAIVAASRATATIPIVAAGSNVVGLGLVGNVARPEGNITGVATNAGETFGKWVELLKETVPATSRLAAVHGAGNPVAQEQLQTVGRVAQNLGLRLAPYDLPDLDRLAAVLATARSEGADGLVVLPGGVLGGGADPRIGGEVLKSLLPAVGEVRLFAVHGGLLSHGVDARWRAGRIAVYVDKLLNGAKPADLPVELPTTFQVVVNLRTAEALGITVPQSVLLRATEVIE